MMKLRQIYAENKQCINGEDDEQRTLTFSFGFDAKTFCLSCLFLLDGSETNKTVADRLRHMAKRIEQGY